MRIIAGEFRSRRLKTLRGMDVRPTPDRLREALFSILAPRIEGAVFLDAYAGIGAVGIEALSRGAAFVRDPARPLPPDQFIPLAEETGLILPIGTWVLREACAKNASWQSAGYAPFNVAVNVSGVQLLLSACLPLQRADDQDIRAKWVSRRAGANGGVHQLVTRRVTGSTRLNQCGL